MGSKVLDQAVFAALVCPVCHHSVTPGPSATRHAWLHCMGCGRYYPVQDGIPVMLALRASDAAPVIDEVSH
jgi:uncharacterized protein YbaR (Trm112 family)